MASNWESEGLSFEFQHLEVAFNFGLTQQQNS